MKAIGNTTFALDALINGAHLWDMQSAAQILDALKQRKITQTAIAKVLGINQPNVNTLWNPAKNGKLRKLTYDEGVALIAAFGLDDEPAEQPASVPSAETLEPILDALLPLVPNGPMTAQSRRALAEAMSYGLALLGSSGTNPANGDAIAVAARAAVLRFRETGLQ